MNKKAGFFGNLFLVVLLVGLAVSFYYLYQFWPSEPVDLQVVQDEPVVVVNNAVPSKQFYEHMRYSDRIITYNIASSCSNDRFLSMETAFVNVESVTVLEFESVSSDPMIRILCSNVAPEAGQEDYFVAGEGGPARVLNSTLYSVILEGKIALYRDDKCDGARVATHELLHALGFDHNNKASSILYPTLRCDQEIDPEIVDSINSLYRFDSLPDLLFFSTQATKSGRYLNFNIEILNQGLKESGPAMVSVYAGEKKVDEFEIGAVGIGARKILTVENLKIPSSTSEISFVVDEANVVSELYENNNIASLKLVQQ